MTGGPFGLLCRYCGQASSECSRRAYMNEGTVGCCHHCPGEEHHDHEPVAEPQDVPDPHFHEHIRDSRICGVCGIRMSWLCRNWPLWSGTESRWAHWRCAR